ncbi:MAG: DUF4058 family protein [Planctomycetaceae bacterium]|nr:DUF4058 family protein [Planctomycetaceae bacterium]
MAPLVVFFLSSPTHLVELDLLRGGMRLPVVDTLPPGDYYAIVSRAKRRPKCEVYAWTLHEKLPVIPIPLKLGDADATVPLQKYSTSSTCAPATTSPSNTPLRLIHHSRRMSSGGCN